MVRFLRFLRPAAVDLCDGFCVKPGEEERRVRAGGVQGGW